MLGTAPKDMLKKLSQRKDTKKANKPNDTPSTAPSAWEKRKRYALQTYQAGSVQLNRTQTKDLGQHDPHFTSLKQVIPKPSSTTFPDMQNANDENFPPSRRKTAQPVPGRNLGILQPKQVSNRQSMLVKKRKRSISSSSNQHKRNRATGLESDTTAMAAGLNCGQSTCLQNSNNLENCQPVPDFPNLNLKPTSETAMAESRAKAADDLPAKDVGTLVEQHLLFPAGPSRGKLAPKPGAAGAVSSYPSQNRTSQTRKGAEDASVKPIKASLRNKMQWMREACKAAMPLPVPTRTSFIRTRRKPVTQACHSSTSFTKCGTFRENNRRLTYIKVGDSTVTTKRIVTKTEVLRNARSFAECNHAQSGRAVTQEKSSKSSSSLYRATEHKVKKPWNQVASNISISKASQCRKDDNPRRLNKMLTRGLEVTSARKSILKSVKSVPGHKSVNFSVTPTKKTPPKPLQKTPIGKLTPRRQLRSWLEGRGQSMSQYRHLSCLGEHIEKSAKMRLALANSLTSNQQSSQMHLGTSPELRPRISLHKNSDEHLNDIQDVGELNCALVYKEIQELLKLGYPPEQSLIWLNKLKNSVSSAVQCASYWECQALAAEAAKQSPLDVLDIYYAALVHEATPVTDIYGALASYMTRAASVRVDGRESSKTEETHAQQVDENIAMVHVTECEKTMEASDKMKQEANEEMDQNNTIASEKECRNTWEANEKMERNSKGASAPPRKPSVDQENQFDSTFIKLGVSRRHSNIFEKVYKSLSKTSPELQIVVTPVRRSARLSNILHDSSNTYQNTVPNCFDSLSHLPDSIKGRVLIMPNPAISETE